jgi:hypothetical protein
MKPSKSLLIIGHPRGGKTTLANMICDRYNFSLISIDAIVNAFSGIYPELGVHHEQEKSEAKLSPFLFKYMDMIKWGTDREFVVEGCHVYPKNADSRMDKDKYKLVVLGCPNIAPEQFASAIRKNDRKDYDWTAEKSDEELVVASKQYINEAKRLESESNEVGAMFIDTSFNREGKFKEFVDGLEDFLK